MAKPPEDRYSTAGEALADLDALSAGRAISIVTTASPALSFGDLPKLPAAPDLAPGAARWLKPNWWYDRPGRGERVQNTGRKRLVRRKCLQWHADHQQRATAPA